MKSQTDELKWALLHLPLWAHRPRQLDKVIKRFKCIIYYALKNIPWVDFSGLKNPAAITGFGAHLRTLRLARNMTQEHLANEAGISRPMLQLIEYGRGNPTLDLLVSLSIALRLTIPELLNIPELTQLPSEPPV